MDGNRVDSSEMLKELRIDRSGGGSQEPRSRVPLISIVLGVLAAGGVGAWAMLGRGSAIEVRTAIAQPVVTANTAGASVLDASGYVTARRQATVSSKVTGRVLEVLIEEGQKVEEGQVLARLDPIDAKAQWDMNAAQLEAARALLAELRVQLSQAQRDEARQNDLVAKKLTSQQSADDARTRVQSLNARITAQERQVGVSQRSLDMAKVQVDNTVVTAPFSGVVTVKAAQQGEIVSPMSAGGGFTRTGIGTIVDMNSLEIEVDVNEAYIGRVQAGQPVESTLNAYPDWKIPGKVIAIIPTADRSKATVKVRIGMDTKDSRIVPDMGARVAFLEEAKPQQAVAKPLPGALVPSTAIKVGADASLAYVVKDGKAEERKLSLGQTFGAQRQVIRGVAIGESVVLEPPAELKSGVRVKQAENR
jgi:RND family efflux transporter MFP subunit